LKHEYRVEEYVDNDRAFLGKVRRSKAQKLQDIEDEGWEIFSIMPNVGAGNSWVVVARRPR
jgi:hypothetical protein